MVCAVPLSRSSAFRFSPPLEIRMKAPPVVTMALHGVPCNISAFIPVHYDKLFRNLLCIIPFLLFYSAPIYYLLHSITTPVHSCALPAYCYLQDSSRQPPIVARRLQQLLIPTLVLVSTPAIFFCSLCLLCLHSAYSFCKNNIFSRSANKI